MKHKQNYLHWFISSILTFLFNEILWNMFIDHTWDIGDWHIYLINFLYCALFVAVSIVLDDIFLNFSIFRNFTFVRQMLLCILILVLNVIIAYFFEFLYNILLPAVNVEQYYGRIYLFCIIATMFTSARNIERYYHIITEQQAQLFSLKKRILKNKLDPHFVFNSLNVLSELISIDQKHAERYCIHFARIYRHILSHIEQDFISVEDSLESIKDYVFLQQYRANGKIVINIIDISTDNNEKLFPLALQTVVENAIKHNMPDKNNSLVITITRDKDDLVITNNKLSDSPSYQSFGIGIQTLCQQYQIENQPAIRITNNDNTYEVRLPILKITK